MTFLFIYVCLLCFHVYSSLRFCVSVALIFFVGFFTYPRMMHQKRETVSVTFVCLFVFCVTGASDRWCLYHISPASLLILPGFSSRFLSFFIYVVYSLCFFLVFFSRALLSVLLSVFGCFCYFVVLIVWCLVVLVFFFSLVLFSVVCWWYVVLYCVACFIFCYRGNVCCTGAFS